MSLDTVINALVKKIWKRCCMHLVREYVRKQKTKTDFQTELLQVTRLGRRKHRSN